MTDEDGKCNGYSVIVDDLSREMFVSLNVS